MTVRYVSGKEVTLHYGQVGIVHNLASAQPDGEMDGRSIVLEYADSSKDFMPYDQPLAAVKDPEYVLRHDIEVLAARIRRQLKARWISLRDLAEHLAWISTAANSPDTGCE